MIESETSTYIQFEENYLLRNYRAVTSIPDISLTEFVANSWDAGAYNVSIKIPNSVDEEISVEDDGVGMTNEEFMQRWMTLNYDRQSHQGRYVVFPDKVDSYKRIAFGRNGIGRHGMICFNDKYEVFTWKNGKCNHYTIAVASGQFPFRIIDKKTFDKAGHGTRICASVQRHLPDYKEIMNIISTRFLYDPRFRVTINGRAVDLLDNKNIVFTQEDVTIHNVKLNITIVDSTKTSNKSQLHGLAFWISGRLVGQPSWNVGKIQFLDGRCKAAKRFTIIIQTDGLVDDILPDWTGFIDTINMRTFLLELKPIIDKFLESIMSEQIEELQNDVINDTLDQLEDLTQYEQRDVSNFLQVMTSKTPIINSDTLKTAVEAVIAMEKAKKGHVLLAQLGQMSADDIDKLSDMLSSWNVDDILAVLNEIDKRITVIEAISRIYEDKSTDELHTLHPLVLSARWLFGPEFDSPMFVSNKTLSTVVSTLFNEKEYDVNVIANSKRRPDIVILKDLTFSAVCTDKVDDHANGIMKPDQILIIELKRGGFEIGADEVSQAEHYVRQIKKSGVLHSSSSIHAFVVGAKIGDVDTHKSSESGTVDVVTYGHLVETAKLKLFRLQEQLSEHYESLDDKSIVEKALQNKQLKL